MPVRRLVGIPPWRTGPTGPASSVGPDRARTPRHFGAGSHLRGFQSSDLLRQPPGAVPGIVALRGSRGGRAHKQSCGTDPALGCALAEERFRLPERGRMSVRGAHVDRGPNPAVAETSGAGLPVSCDRDSSSWPARSAITGPSWGLNGYYCSMAQLLRSVIWRRIHQAGLDMSMGRLLSQLEDIREVINLYPKRRKAAKMRQQTVLTRMSKVQKRLVEILGLEREGEGELG